MGLFRQITASIFLIFFCFPFRTGAEEFLDSFGLLRSDSNSLLSCTTDGTLLKTNKLGEIAAYPKPKKQTKKYKKKRKKLKQEIEALTALIEKGGKGIQKLKKKRKKKKAKRKLLKARIAFIKKCTQGELSALSLLKEEANIFYDAHGVPHIRAYSDNAAFYGLGYAQARLRTFQLFFQRARMQGRLAEYFGPTWGSGSNTVDLVSEDRVARTRGWAKRAEQVYEQLSESIRGYLDAFAQGVNDSLAEHYADSLPAPFGSIGVDTFEPWTGVDCLIAYTAISSHFTGGEGGELPAEMKFQHDVDALGTQGAVELWQSESQFKDWDSAIIQTNPQLLMSQVNRSGLSSLLPETLKASHNWVVDGAHNTSGAPVMVSMPMLDLEKRWLLEAQIDSPSFHAHGVAMVGTPGFLIGYTPSTAWSATALGSDLADLFRLQAPQEMPEATHYRLDNQDVPFTIREEEIHVLGHSSETIAVRESYFGPVVSIGNDGTKYALKHIILSDLDDGRIHPLEGMFALAQGKTLTEMKEAAWKLFYPSIHLLYATKDPAPTGGIGYRPAAALPIRSNAALLQGVIPQDGSLSSSDWQGFYSEQATPFMHNPASGVIVTANGLPTDDASIYGYQASGTTERGWRARKLLQDLFDEHGMLTPDEIASVRFDCGLELAESVRTLTNYLVKNYPALIPQNDEAFVALSYLNAWDGSLDTSSPYAPMARVVRSIARNKDFYAHTSMSRDYPFPAAFFRSLDVEGESYSLANDYVEDAIQWVFIGILPTAWQLVNSSPSESEFGHGSDPQFWNSYVKKTISIPYVEGITLKETVDPAFDIETEQVICPSKLTLHSQEGNFYTQITPLIDINGSQTAIAPGNSDNPASQFYSSELSGFQVGKVSASPIDRNLIESNCVATSVEGCSYEKPLYDPQ